MKHLANTITFLRIVLSAFLLLTKPFDAAFFTLYTLCGLSDIADGAVARITDSKSDIGAAIDSAADFVFMLCVFIKLFPTLYSPRFTAALLAVAAIKLTAVLVGAVKFHKIISLHTSLNKATGLFLFCTVFFLPFFKTHTVIVLAFALALAAAFEELLCMILLKSLRLNIRSVFQLKNRKEQNKNV